MSKSQELCAALKTARKEKRMTQSKLGEVIGVKQQYVYQLEKGVHSPNVATFCELANALGYDVVLVKKEAM